MTSRPGPELAELIGEAALIRLAEEFGGTRIYVPERMPADHDIVRTIGAEAARALADRYASDKLSVPLARELRARHYRAQKMNDRQIARALGIAEASVYRLFRRLAERDDRQLPLFGDA